MAEADIIKAMAPFGRVDSSLSRKYEGTGLGLPLTRHLVDLHEGELTVERTRGEGPKITILIPRHRVPTGPVALAPLRAAGPSPSLSPGADVLDRGDPPTPPCSTLFQ